MRKFRNFLLFTLAVMTLTSSFIFSGSATTINIPETHIDKNSYFHWYPDTEGNKSNGWVVTKAANQSCRVVVGEKGYDMEIGMYYRPDGVYTPTFFDGTNSSTTISRNYTSKLDTALYRPYVRNASTVEMTVESGSRFIFV